MGAAPDPVHHRRYPPKDENMKQAQLPEHNVTTSSGGLRGRMRLVMWRRRYLNVRRVVAAVALASLLAPGAAAIIDAAL